MIPTPFIRLVAATLLAVTIARSAEAQHLTIGSSLPATSPFLGGVPQGAATTQPVFISIGDAIQRALAYNLGVLEAEERVGRADGARWIALSERLPHLNATASESRRTFNLEAFGFPLLPGFPRLIGPFNVFDARVFLTQSVFDRSMALDR